MLNDTLTITISKDEMDSVLDLSINLRTFKVKLKNELIYPIEGATRINGGFFSSDSIGFNTSQGHTPNLCTYNGKKN
jgi:hypothetical protein